MTSLLKPGILVSAKTSIRGGVSYARKDLDASGAAIEATEATEIARWETTRVIEDAQEHERACKARSAALVAIRRVCTTTSFGLLCPLANEGDLDAAIAEAREISKGFNDGAQHSTLNVYVLKGRIAETDEEATRAIADEIAGLMDQMDRGVRDSVRDPAAAVKAIRDAANRARGMEQMLSERDAETVGRAIQAARKAAREIVQRVEKGGEAAEVVLRDLWTGPIEKARFAFLEMSADESANGAALPAVSMQRFGSMELPSDREEDTGSETLARRAGRGRSLEVA